MTKHPPPRKSAIPPDLLATLEIMGISWSSVMARATLTGTAPAACARRMIDDALSREERAS